QTSGFLNLPNNTPQATNEVFSFYKAIVSGDVVRLTNLELSLKIPMSFPAGTTGVQWENRNVLLKTDVDIKAGQKVAIGKASIDPAGDAIILVVSAKVVD